MPLHLVGLRRSLVRSSVLGTLGTMLSCALFRDSPEVDTAPGLPERPGAMGELLVGILLAAVLAFRAIEFADRFGTDFNHTVLDAVLFVFTGADGTLHEHE